jgi:hypothetical protein
VDTVHFLGRVLPPGFNISIGYDPKIIWNSTIWGHPIKVDRKLAGRLAALRGATDPAAERALSFFSSSEQNALCQGMAVQQVHAR